MVLIINIGIIVCNQGIVSMLVKVAKEPIDGHGIKGPILWIVH